MLAALKNDLVDDALAEMLKDANLERKFANIFEPNNDADKVGM
jgi:hypothetical protein